jgi:hypothetical protein
MNPNFEHLYINIDISDKKYEILSFTYLPVETIKTFYEKIHDVEDFITQSLTLIHLSLKNPTDFNKIKTTITFDEMHDIMNSWVKTSLYYSEWVKGNIDSNGDTNKNIRLKTALANLIVLIESGEAATEEEHLFYIEKFSEMIQKHAQHYNKITSEHKINKIISEVKDD